MNRQKINDNWLFVKDDQELYQKKLIGDSVLINLPHTFNQEEIKTDDPIFRGATWYQKKIILQEADLEGELYLEIGAASLQSVVYVNGQQADVYFSHPYASWERGTSENQYKLIRRFIPRADRLVM